jgi:hypothetical protein
MNFVLARLKDRVSSLWIALIIEEVAHVHSRLCRIPTVPSKCKRFLSPPCHCLRLTDSHDSVYTIHGGKDLPEEELPHLAGHKKSRPVRIGNGAVDHLQLVSLAIMTPGSP